MPRTNTVQTREVKLGL